MEQFIKIFLKRTFSQNDPAWKNATLGTKSTIGASGCLETDAATVADYYGADETPLTLNEKLKNNNGYASGNEFVWGVFATLFGLKYSNQFSNADALTTDQMNQIRGAIDKGFPVFLQIDTIPATSQLDEHWLLAIGYDGDDFIVQDPWDGAKKRITSWGVAPQKLIYAWCWFEGNVPTQTQEQTIAVPVSERDWLISRATVAKDVATYLGIDDPDHALEDSYTRAVAGIRSAVTAAQTAAQAAKDDLAKANQQVLNDSETIGTLKTDLAKALDRENSLSGQLNLSSQNTAKAVAVVQGQLSDMTAARNSALKDKQNALLQVVGLQSQLTACQKGQAFNGIIESLIEKIKNFFTKKQ